MMVRAKDKIPVNVPCTSTIERKMGRRSGRRPKKYKPSALPSKWLLWLQSKMMKENKDG